MQHNVVAQTAQEYLNKGTDAHRFFKLAEAEEYLAKAIELKHELTNAEKGEALYFYAITILKDLEVNINSKNYNLVTSKTQMRIYNCYDTYLELAMAKIPRWSPKVNDELIRLNIVVIKAALDAVDKYLTNHDEYTYNIAQGYIALANTIEPVHYIPYELWGNLSLAKNDNLAAIEHFSTCINLYTKFHRNILDNIRIGQIYLRLALTLKEDQTMIDSAQNLIKIGVFSLTQEYHVIEQQKTKYSNDERNLAKQTYYKLKKDLNLAQLEFISIKPNPKKNEIELFEYYADTFKNDPSYHFYYGISLTRTDEKKAIEQFNKAIQLDSNYTAAFFTLGIYQSKLGEIQSRKANASNKNEDYAKAFKYYTNAFKAFKRNLELDPINKISLNHIITIGNLLGEDVTKYTKQLSQLE